MTEKSYVWDHSATGDAAYSPYNAEEFNNFHFIPVISDATDVAYVIPYYADDLEVVLAGTGFHSVSVKAGAALVNNYFYIQDEATTLPIDRVAQGYYRRDRIILRFDQTLGDPQVRLAVLKGVEDPVAYSTVLPPLTQTTGVYEVCLADVFVNGTFSDDPYAIADQRRFIYTAMSQVKTGGFIGNLLRNSEFLGYTAAGTVAPLAPDAWIRDSITGTFVSGNTHGSGRDNRSVVIDTGLTGLLRCRVVAGSAGVYTMSGIITANTGRFFAQIQARRKDGGLSTVTKYWVSNYQNLYNSYFQFTTKFPEDDIIELEIYFSSISGSASIIQPILVAGYHPALNRPVNEVIMANRARGDAGWTATAKSSGTTAIDLAATFGSVVLNNTKAVILRLRGRDSGSNAAANCYMRVLGYSPPYSGDYGTLHLEGITNDNWREIRCIIPVEHVYWATGNPGAQLRIVIAASGAGTFDATVQIVGIIV